MRFGAAIRPSTIREMITIALMTEMANHTGNEVWPSLEVASKWFDRASIGLSISLAIGLACTVVIVWLGIVKEHHWDLLRDRAAEKIATVELDAAKSNAEAAKAHERIAGLNNETARQQADNLALQTALLPRHVGLIGIDEEPKAKTWFAGFERWAGIKVLIQTVPGDLEAQNLANEIAIVLSRFGWVPELIDEKRSGVSLQTSEGLSVISPTSYKAWDPKNETHQMFGTLAAAARALATALTNAGLGVGSYPVGGVHGYMMVVDFPPDSDGEAHNPFRKFSPKLHGVYLQVGSRPVAATVAWIKQGRPDTFGNRATSVSAPETHK